MTMPADGKDKARRATLIGLDWGTTSLRAYLFGTNGEILERRAEASGVLNVADRGFAAARDRIAGDWMACRGDLAVIACGMIGSTVGWREVPYVACPAGFAELAQALAAQRRAGPADGLIIVPGLNVAFGQSTSGSSPPDVMRGEETQVLGALELRPEFGDGCRLIMPGTHSKWVHVAHGQIRRFRTYMTGEVFAVLREHSILGRPARAAMAESTHGAGSTAVAGAAFEQGVADAKSAGAAGLASRLFAVRTRVLAGHVDARDSIDYLSGILIGDELRTGLAEMQDDRLPLALIGDPRMCTLYLRAIALFDHARVAALDDTAPAGLWRLATAAGLTKQ